MTIAARNMIWRRRGGRGEITVFHVELTRGTVFQVCAEWRGPGDEPAPGQPDPRTYTADYYDADRVELARALAGRALEELRALRAPDLRALAAELKRRDRGLLSDRRGENGASLMGDTAPDERPE
jgi:hypothetical protein